MIQKLVFRCKICSEEVVYRIAHFWRYHYEDKKEELWNLPNMMADIDNKYFEGVTIQK